MKKIEKKLLEENLLENLSGENFMEEILAAKKTPKTKKIEVITDFSKVPENEVLSSAVTYFVYNKTTETDSFLNGKAIDGLIGMNQDIRNMLTNKIRDNFSVDNYLVKFNCYVING